MILDTIRRPEDLKELSHRQLNELCVEIREFIVDTVNRTGGHLGSNLGIVELTVALHRVLDSPTDALLFDTGHQAYVHKLLTGRKDAFDDKFKKAGGLSGYPSRAESPHDWIENSHASTVLSYAHGLATAKRVNQQLADKGDIEPIPAESKRGRIVAVIGDGSLTGGMAYEGLNNLGHSGARVTIVYNDNGRSYAPTVSRLGDSLVKIRSNPVYMKRQRRLEHFTARLPIIGKLSLTGIKASKAAIREALEPQTFFEPLGIRYMGPFDGHDIPELELALRNASKFDGPVVLHVMTQKGRGYEPALNDSVKLMHDTSAIPVGDNPDSYTDAFSEGLIKLADANPKVVAITAAMPDSTGLLPFMERFPDRCFDVGIAEQHAVTAAAGMAMDGLTPVVALYSTFLTRAIDQVNLDVGLHGQKVIFCLDRAGITGNEGPSHNGVLDMVLLSKVPNMTIFAPSSYQELQQMLVDAHDMVDGPSCIRWPKTPAPSVTIDQLGTGLRARKVVSGTDVAIIGVGKMLSAATEAAEILADEGISATVWDPRVVKPLDRHMLDDAANHKLVITVEDGLADGGIGSAIAADLSDSNIPVKVLGVPTEYLSHDSCDVLLEALGLGGAGVARSTLKRYEKLG